MPGYSQFPNENEYERLIEEEEPVFSVRWDSGTPGGGADAEHVYRWGDGYILLLSEGEDETVYPTLREAIEETKLNYMTRATSEITSTEMSSEVIAALLQTREEGSYRVLLNGEAWEPDGSGGFRKAAWGQMALVRPHPNSYAVLDTGVLAGEYPSTPHPAEARSKLRAYLDAGVDYFVDLTEENELRPYEAVLREEVQGRRMAVDYVRLPIRDMDVCDRRQMRRILDRIDAGRNAGAVYTSTAGVEYDVPALSCAAIWYATGVAGRMNSAK